MADSVRRRLRQTTHPTCGAVLTGARWLARQEASGELAHLDGWVLHLLRVPGDPPTSIGPSGWGPAHHRHEGTLRPGATRPRPSPRRSDLSELPERALSPGRRPVPHAGSLARPLRGATTHQVYLLTVALVATFLIACTLASTIRVTCWPVGVPASSGR